MARKWLIAALAFLAMLGAAGIAVALAQPEPPKGPPLARRYAGVNIAGGEFAPEKMPGRYGYDYLYPNAAAAAPFLAEGMDAVRVPVLWERLQPFPGGALDTAALAHLDESVAALSGFALIVIDIHNYGGYRGVKLGQPDRPGALLADLWRRLAQHYGKKPRVAFGLMNEPVDIPARTWREIAEGALIAIRKTGARNLVLVPGANWDGAHSWMTGGADSNGAALAGLRDPADNMAFEMHQYADSNSSGVNPDCVSPEAAAGRFAAATRWLRTNKARGFLGEFGVPPNPACLAALDAMLTALDDADDVWLGWTYWAGGSLWGPYPLSVQPDASGAKPQMAVLRRHLRRVPDKIINPREPRR